METGLPLLPMFIKLLQSTNTATPIHLNYVQLSSNTLFTYNMQIAIAFLIKLLFFPLNIQQINVMDFIFQLSLSTISLVIAYKLFKKLTTRLPPGPRPWPIIGKLDDVKTNKFECFTRWAQHYGPIFSIWIGSSLNVIISNSELAREVFKENDPQLADRYRSRSIAKISVGKDLLWADYGPHYVKVKNICVVELFSPKRLEALRPIREDEATAMVESIFKDYNSGKFILSFSFIYASFLLLLVGYLLYST